MIQVFLIDNQIYIYEALKVMFASTSDIHVSGYAKNAEQSVWSLKKILASDVILIDIQNEGISALDKIYQVAPLSKILLFSDHMPEIWVKKALKCGVCGYVSKTNEPEKLYQGIRNALEGHLTLAFPDSPEQSTHSRIKKIRELSPRENEVCMLLVQGFSNKQIAQEIDVTQKAVGEYKRRSFDKLEVSNVFELKESLQKLGLCE